MTDGASLLELVRRDRELFSSLLKHVVQAAPNEDPSDFVLESIGRNVGADRCYVYRFWEPGKSSMCTNTHEWCAEGITPEIGGQQTCNLADLVEFNACITAGRDFLFTDLETIDAGSREWLEPQGIKSLIATPLVGAGGTICGFAGFDFVKAPAREITSRIIVNIHEAADLLLNCQRLHERDMALMDVTRRENERLESDRDLDCALAALQKDVRTMHPRQMLEIVRSRLDADLCYMVQDVRAEGGGTILPGHAIARGGWTNARSWTIEAELGRALDMRHMTSSVVSFRGAEIDWLKANICRETPPPDFGSRLKVVHSTGVLQDGRLVGVLCAGFVGDRALSPPLAGFLRRSALVVVSSLERIATYHDLAVALNLAHLKGDIVEFMFKHQDYGEVRDFIGAKMREIIGAQHLVLCSDDGSRADWFGDDAPECCHDCVKAALNYGRHLPERLFSEDEMVVVPEGTKLPDMNLPHYCPMRSSVISQMKRGGGWWRLVADYTKPHKEDLAEAAHSMRMGLELLAIAYDRERHEETIARLQENQRYRADMLAYALSKDDIPGLMDLVLGRLVELSACDCASVGAAGGERRALRPGGEPETVREPFAPGAAKSQELAVVCDGRPWGSIALHYRDGREAPEDGAELLRIAADVLTLALERHSAAVRLKAERDRVVEAEKSRSYFFSAVSHDIRTPLNAIIGFSELLQAGGVTPAEAKQDLKMIVASGKTLLQLVNDVLDLSKMDLGKLEFSLEPTDVGEVVREIMPVFKPMTLERGQTIVTDIPEGLPRVMVDPHRFRQVLFNFVSNAVKYAGPCTIRVLVAYEGGRLKLEVSDDGRGVSAEKAKRLMQPFVQADIKNRTEGSGLGLAICKRLVEIAHGSISIDTAPGRGFAIRTVVPVEVAQEGGKSVAAGPSAAVAAGFPRRVLVVDDSPVNRAVMKAMLKKLGITDVELAGDGVAALEKLEGDPGFDLVMSDMWMPAMDGAELVRRIRSDGRLARLKVCSITADVEARTTYREQGFDALLLKPVTIEKMADLFSGMPDV